MTDDLPQLVQRLRDESQWFGTRKWGDTGLRQHGEAAAQAMQDAATALDTLTRALAEMTQERDEAQRQAAITSLSIPCEDELSPKIDELLRDIAMEQWSRVWVARLLRDCQRRMADDWVVIGRERRERLAAESTLTAAVREARAETTTPALHCASCGATHFSRLYTGGGDVWLHPADEEDSAACGPVYFAAASRAADPTGEK